MEYGEFKETLLGQLRDFYGNDGNVSLGKMKDNDEKEHDGLWIVLAKEERAAVPVIRMEELYKDYQSGKLADMVECVETVICSKEQYLYPKMHEMTRVLK